MGAPTVVFDRVWKKFRRGERHDSLRDLLPAVTGKLFARAKQTDLDVEHEFWALQDISFEVGAGEALGIIGPNGAGKSTTLKLLTRILRPTVGTSAVRGRIGALIEVAAGFHPDLTGRENVFLQGAIMGMRRLEITAKLDEIIEFAGVRSFIDTPVKRYSSGMNARLGFSIAAHLDPEVLIIDEVLSVGDMQFQERCVQRMKDFKHSGVTIVFVSHNLQAISSLCDRALLLGRPGGLLGPTRQITEAYVRATELAPAASAGSATPVTIDHVTLTTTDGQAVSHIEPGARLRLTAKYTSRKDLGPVQFGFIVRRATDGLIVYDDSITIAELGFENFPADRSLALQFDFTSHLARGQYYAELHVHHPVTNTFLVRLKPAAFWYVDETRTYEAVAYLDLSVIVVANEARSLKPLGASA